MESTSRSCSGEYIVPIEEALVEPTGIAPAESPLYLFRAELDQVPCTEDYNGEKPTIDFARYYVRDGVKAENLPTINNLQKVIHCHPEPSDMLKLIYSPNVQIGQLATLYANVRRCQKYIAVFRDYIDPILKQEGIETSWSLGYLFDEVAEHDKFQDMITGRLKELSANGGRASESPVSWHPSPAPDEHTHFKACPLTLDE